MTSTHKVCDLRIVLLGKTGSGKSAAGNTILGKKVFEVADFIKSTSKVCEKQEAVVGGNMVSIIDTPGLFNTAMKKHQLKAEIEKCVEMCSPGPHVFLLVLKLGVRFTKEERDTVKWIRENFGEEALRRTIILFTHADQLRGKPLEEYIKESDYLQEIVRICGGRYHSFNNEDRKNQDQVTELLDNIISMMSENQMIHYTLEMFRKKNSNQKKKKKKKKFKTACVVAVLGIGLLGTVKIAGKIAAAFTGRATAAEAVEKAIEAAGEGAVSAIEAAQSVAEKAAETATEAAQTAAEKVVDTAGESVQAVAEKAAETAAEAVETVSAGAGGAARGAFMVAAVAAAVEAVERVAAGAGGAFTVAAAVAAAAVARHAAIAGKVTSSGRVSAITAVVAGGAVVALISALKP